VFDIVLLQVVVLFLNSFKDKQKGHVHLKLFGEARAKLEALKKA
jgi:hypothetical protein